MAITPDRGRPRELPEHVQVNVRMPIEQDEWLLALARRHRLDKSKMIRSLIAAAMAAEMKETAHAV